MLQAVTAIFQAIARNFQDQGSDDGPWAALAPITAARKEKAGRTAGILIWSGALRDDWEVNVNDTGTVGTVKSSRFYGTFHQLGTIRMPQRRVLPTEERSRDIASRFFEPYVSDVVEGR